MNIQHIAKKKIMPQIGQPSIIYKNNWGLTEQANFLIE